MLALVKPAPGPGLELREVPVPEDRHQRRPHPGPADRHLRDRPPHRRLGSMGGPDDPSAARRRPRVRRGDRRGRQQRDRLPPGRDRQRRGSRRVRAVPPLPRRPAPPVRPHDRAGRRAGRRVRRVRRPADDEHLASLAGDRPGGGGDLRPVRERGPHGARLPRPRRGRAHQRRRPDRPDGHRGRPSCRRPVRRRVRAEPVPARPGAADGRHGRRRSGRARPGRGRGRARDGRGLRRRARDVGGRRGPPLGDRRDGPRRRDRDPRHPDRRDLDRRERDRVQDAHPAGDLRSRDVRDLVQDDGDAPVGAGHPPGDHPPLRLPRLRGRLRRRPLGRIGQGHHDVDAVAAGGRLR